MKLQLTAKDILKKSFKTETKGYCATEVDLFLDKVLSDYRLIDSVMAANNTQIERLLKENQYLKNQLSKKDAELSDNHNIFLANPDTAKLDNLELLKKISKYEKKLYQMGVDPSKIK